MVSRRNLLGAAAAGAGSFVLVPGVPVRAEGSESWKRSISANGWRIDQKAIGRFRIEGSLATVPLCHGAAAVLLHVARRWHYEIAPLDTGEGGGVLGHHINRRVGANFESNYLSGTAIALHPRAYPLGGSERLWPHHEQIVRDILVDCDGTVAWGGDLDPVKPSHFHLVARDGSKALIRVSERLGTGVRVGSRLWGAGAVADPALPSRQERARRLARPR
ncbi:hypothetical protein GCM10012279_18000 [Micromonospora yangpuensis]|uniref:Tat (Twin-arginine translocation) pathway signal sequence n=1 Tax=Micromonospora yangpuensis TaxID=683228 RepID=A0A1C6TVZ4_9ACTN|nr:hypothetical protein GCM10012279_18000 [Micromonospora yangpuensis]SCL45966.1 Tat (twin-arginine translocation) pathway signal sequence [Micromonospora yangpuensis]